MHIRSTKAINGYLAKAFHEGESAATVTSDNDGIKIVICAEKVKHAGGCWSGRWKSEWTVKGGSIDGTVCCFVFVCFSAKLLLFSSILGLVWSVRTCHTNVCISVMLLWLKKLGKRDVPLL